MTAGENNEELQLNNNIIIRSCHMFNCLGVTYSKTGTSDDTDISTKIAHSKREICQLNSVESISTYDCEVWEFNKRNRSCLKVMVIDFWGRNASISKTWHVTNEEVTQQMKVMVICWTLYRGSSLYSMITCNARMMRDGQKKWNEAGAVKNFIKEGRKEKRILQ